MARRLRCFITDKKVKIYRKDFAAYEAVRESGVTNMWMWDVVHNISGLEFDQIGAIIANYNAINKFFPGIRKKDPVTK